MAGFEVITYGRFWPITEEVRMSLHVRVKSAEQLGGNNTGTIWGGDHPK
jgi:hypothetical protein